MLKNCTLVSWPEDSLVADLVIWSRLSCTALKYEFLFSKSGRSHKIDLSSLPGRSRAESIRSGREVAARTYTPSSPSAPSICVNSWLTTLSVTPVESWPLFGAIESNSSKNRIHGFALCALSNSSRILCSEAPIYLLRISGPLIEMKFKPHCAATADASSVLPQPGYP